MAKQRISSATLIVESTPDNLNRSEVFSWQEMLASIQRVRNANIALIIFDEHGVPVRSATVGNPSDQMKAIIASESVPEEVEVEAVTA
jgi:hypothetical protein